MDDVFYEVILHKATLIILEVVSILGISTYRVYKLIHQGKIKAYKEDGYKSWHIPSISIRNYLQSHIK